MMDRIRIFVDPGEAVAEAIEGYDAFIRKETLADEILEKKDLPSFDLNGEATGIEVERI
jgi:hypothetical protein